MTQYTHRPGPRAHPTWMLAVLPLLPALAVGFLLDDYFGLVHFRE